MEDSQQTEIILDAGQMDHRELNEALRRTEGPCRITGCCGQRFIAAGMGSRRLTIEGIPGNALGAYLNGGDITVLSNAQDAVGDTMNAGRIVICGSIGDAAGYAMRGGRIYIRDDAGYRAGIHMKAYQEKVPVMIIGGTAGSFLGEYQAGGVIIVLDLKRSGRPIVSNFPCTGMHGGRLYLRSDCRDILFPEQVTARTAGPEDLKELRGYLEDFCRIFGYNTEEILSDTFTVVTPDTSNPYRQMYVAN